MHTKFMEQGLSISIVLHLLLLGFLFWNPFYEQKGDFSSSIETVSLMTPQTSQKERIKGVKKPEFVENTEKSLKTKKVKNQKKGNAKDDAPAIQGGTNNPQLLAVASYARELQYYIEKHRFYPRRALFRRQTGVVKILLKLDAQGRFISVEVLEKSPHEVLNQSAYKLVMDLKKFKPLPEEYRGTGEFIIPINYQL